MIRSKGVAAKGASLLLALTLAVLGVALAPCIPQAEAANSTDLAINDAQAAVSSSRYSLEEAQARLNEITAEYNTLSSEIDEMQSKIDDLAQQVLEAQNAMLAGRDALSDTAVYEYRNNTSTMLLNILLGSQSISELTTNMSYIDQLMNYQAEEIANQKRLKSELETVSEQLTAQKDEQESKLAELDRKQSEAQSVVNSVSAELAANSEHLAALKAQAAALKRAEAKVTQEVDPAATTVSRPDSTATPAPSSSPSSQSTQKPPTTSAPQTSSSGEGWRTGLATAYGGSSDPNTPNPGRTATGSTCNDWSMGVAVPMAWSNYRSYFGRTVEITWNGRTVYATVNDCGGMRGGYISLDLQPGVFKAFGFNSCQGWGVRTVQYRFL